MSTVVPEPTLPPDAPIAQPTTFFEDVADTATGLGKAFLENNDVVNAVEFALKPDYKADPTYQAFADPDNQPYAANFGDDLAYAVSADHARSIRAQIDRTIQRAEEMERGGVVAKTVGGLAGAFLSPTIFLPIGQALKVGTAATKLGKAAAVVDATLKSAAAGALGIGISEIPMQLNKVDYEAERSYDAIGTGALLAGGFGGALRFMDAGTVKKATDFVNNLREGKPSTYVASPASGGAAVVEDVYRTSGLVEAPFGLEKVLGQTSPPARVLMSDVSQILRDTMRKISDGGLRLKEAAKGKAPLEGGTIENLIIRDRGRYFAAPMSQLKKLYSRYYWGPEAPAQSSVGQWARDAGAAPLGWVGSKVPTQGAKRLSESEWGQEITKAIDNGGKHPDPTIAEAARLAQTVYRQVGKNAIEAGTLKNPEVLERTNYNHIQWSGGKIKANRNEFRGHVKTGLQKGFAADFAKGQKKLQALVKAGKTDAYKKLAAALEQKWNERWGFGHVDFRKPLADQPFQERIDEIAGKIVGEFEDVIERAYQIDGTVQTPYGAARNRLLDFLDLTSPEIQKFREMNFFNNLDHYTKGMVPQIHMDRVFGKDGLSRVLEDAQMEIDAKAAKLPPAQAEKLVSEFRARQKDLMGTIERVYNRYAIPNDPYSLGPRLLSATKRLVYSSQLGNVLFSQATDFTNGVLKYGAEKVANSFSAYTQNIKGIRDILGRETIAMGAATDTITNAVRWSEDVMVDSTRFTKAERGLERIADIAPIAHFQSQATDIASRQASAVVSTNILHAVENVALGKGTPEEIAELAEAGITKRLANLIHEEFKNPNGVVKVDENAASAWIADTAEWSSREARDGFQAAVVRNVRSIVIQPGLERSFWVSKGVGQYFGIFRSFSLASLQKITLAGLQRNDAKFYYGMMLNTATALASQALKASFYGGSMKERFDNMSTAELVFLGMDKGAVLPMAGDVAAALAAMTDNKYGSTRGPSGRYRTKGDRVLQAAEAIGGAGVSYQANVLNASLSLMNGKGTERDIHQLGNATPLLGAFYIRALVDEAEKNLSDALGLKPEKKR
jgi:hypothetical protein